MSPFLSIWVSLAPGPRRAGCALRLTCFALIWFVADRGAVHAAWPVIVSAGFGGRLRPTIQSRHYAVILLVLDLMYDGR